MFHPGWRDDAVRRLSGGFDLLVIGGGITGCGIALDAAQRGLSVLLVERGDIASGTSSRSSKLIHGGLRYLKQMQLRVTRQACRERDRMLALSPHLVHPIRFLYPASRGDRVPGWQIEMGLWMYDRLTARAEKHGHVSREELTRLAPGLEVPELDRALSYTDAMADDARLTLAVAATAHAAGAAVLTRCEAEGPVVSGGRVAGAVLHDLEGGRVHRVTAGVVVNATGVWTDVVRDRMGASGQKLRPSRGSHLVLAPGALHLEAAVTLPSPDDGRPVFLIPHPEGVLLGTTDLYHDGSLDDPRPTRAEVDYLLRAATAAFPAARLGPDQVRGAFAGLRPILDTHAEEPSEASREEALWEEQGLLSIAGGKLTTWRSTAEEAVAAALKLLPDEVARRAAPSATAGTPLAGRAPADLADRLMRAGGLEPAVAEGMARRLGALAWSARLLARRPRELRPLAGTVDLCPAEIRAHLRWGAVLHLDDLIVRRVRIGLWQPTAVGGMLRRLRSVCMEETGWRLRRWNEEVERLGGQLELHTLEGVR